MFFIGIFGIQSKSKVLRDFDTVICPDCGRWSRAELIEEYTYFHIFFIPVYKWNRRYYLRLRCCHAVYEADEAYAGELAHSEDIDFSKLRKIGPSIDLCPNCSTPVDPGFSYCPRCGHRL